MRSLGNFLIFSRIVDSFTVWDNSTDAETGEPPILLMDKEGERTQVHDQAVFGELMFNASMAAQLMGSHALAVKFRNLSNL